MNCNGLGVQDCRPYALDTLHGSSGGNLRSRLSLAMLCS